MAYEKDWQLPRVGEAVESARVIQWHVAPGDTFSDGQILLEIDTDKTVIEVPADRDGKLVKQLVAADETIEADTALARIEVAGELPAEEQTEDADQEPVEAPEESSVSASEPPTDEPGPSQSTTPPPAPEVSRSGERTFATPVARKIAQQESIDLAAIRGTGPRGRITKADVTRAAAASSTAVQTGSTQRGPTTVQIEEQSVATAHGELQVRRWLPAGAPWGSTLVLIHGFFSDLETWEGTARGACRRGQRVIAMDLPAHGRSRSGASHLGDIVEAAAEVTARLADGAVALVGHSLGAAIAARIARKPDIHTTSLTLIAPIGLGTEIEQSFLNGMVNAGSIAALERELGKLTAGGATPSSAYVKKLREHLEEQSDPLAALVRQVSWNGVQQLDITADLSALECPISLIHGRSDAIVPWEHVLNAPARAALHLPKQVGHMPQWEATGLVGEVLQRAGALT